MERLICAYDVHQYNSSFAKALNTCTIISNFKLNKENAEKQKTEETT